LEPGRAEIAFTVDDRHQALGLGSFLMRHLTAIARQAGLKELVADVAMLKVAERSGLAISVRREPGATHVSLRLS
jgi:GNAT superfamily N-acetyltransferase